MLSFSQLRCFHPTDPNVIINPVANEDCLTLIIDKTSLDIGCNKVYVD